jgi:hypothetical protein
MKTLSHLLSPRPALLALMLIATAGCAQLPFLDKLRSGGATTGEALDVAAITAAPVPPPGARTAEALDTTTAAQRAAATAAPRAATQERTLGKVIVALGNPAEPGFWLKTDLVTTPGPGRVLAAGGATVQVDLIPLSGVGATQLSLAAFRALGLPLTDLAEVTVLAR